MQRPGTQPRDLNNLASNFLEFIYVISRSSTEAFRMSPRHRKLIEPLFIPYAIPCNPNSSPTQMQNIL